MSIMALLARGKERTRLASSSRRKESRRRKNEFVSWQLEQFEERIVMSGVTMLPYTGQTNTFNTVNNLPGFQVGPGTLNDPAVYQDTSGNTLANNIGLIAKQPTQNGNFVEMKFLNQGTKTVTIGVAVYQDQAINPSQPAPVVNLSQEVLIGIQYYTVAPGASLTVDTSLMMCTQVDSFIAQVNCVTVSDVVTQFTPGDQIYPGPAPDAGYNYNPTTGAINAHTTGSGTSTSPFTPPPGVVGTLLSYTNTSGPNAALSCPPGSCHSECYWANNPGAWNLPSFSATLTNASGKTTVIPTITGLAIGDEFYTVNQLENILDTNSASGNAALTLAQEEIYGKLNLINNYQGTSQYPLSAEISFLTKADSDMATYMTGPLGSSGGYVWASSTAGKVLLSDAQNLDGYNMSCNCGSGCGYGWNNCWNNSCNQVIWCSSHDTNCGKSWGGNGCGISNWSSDSCNNSWGGSSWCNTSGGSGSCGTSWGGNGNGCGSNGNGNFWNSFCN